MSNQYPLQTELARTIHRWLGDEVMGGDDVIDLA